MAYTTIDDPSAYFQTKLYTGTQNSHAITLDGNSDLQPDWVWIKCRDDTHNHQVFDSVRGVHKRMRTDTNGAETTSDQSLKSFDSDGFTLGTEQNVNASASNDNSFVAWNWKETATAGFDIVSYTGTGSSNAVSHSLSATPSMIIIKNRDDADSWYVWHQGLGAVASNYINLDTSGPKSSVSDGITAISSSNFTVNTRGDVNASSEKYIAYCFADVKGYSKFGEFIGNGNANGTFVYTGFKPAWILVKNIEISEGAWVINDNKRNAFNPNSNTLTPHNSETENTGTDRTDFLSNGFKLRVGSSTAWNGSGNTIVYMAFAESPFVTSTGVPATAR